MVLGWFALLALVQLLLPACFCCCAAAAAATIHPSTLTRPIPPAPSNPSTKQQNTPFPTTTLCLGIVAFTAVDQLKLFEPAVVVAGGALGVAAWALKMK